MCIRADVSGITIREAMPEDVPLILSFIRELAEYERLIHEVTATEETLHHSLFGERKGAEVVFACLNEKPVGFALFFHNFSTFLGKPGIYIEDLFVKPHMRGRGVGKALLGHIARIALSRGCGRLEWWVLDWNEPAVRFYRSIGAVPMSDWTVHRVAGQVLEDLSRNA